MSTNSLVSNGSYFWLLQLGSELISCAITQDGEAAILLTFLILDIPPVRWPVISLSYSSHANICLCAMIYYAQ